MKQHDSRKLKSRGITEGLFRDFADGQWHSIYEALAQHGSKIPPELAVREYLRAGGTGGQRGVPVIDQVEIGRRLIIARILRVAGAEPAAGSAPRSPLRWQRFRLFPRTRLSPRKQPLTPDERLEIVRRVDNGESTYAVAHDLGIPRGTAYAVVADHRRQTVT